MIAKSNALFLGRRNYDRKDEKTGELETKYIYDFVVFDSEGVNGLINPSIKSMVLSNEPNDVAESLFPLQRCIVELEIRIYSSKTVMSICGVQEV